MTPMPEHDADVTKVPGALPAANGQEMKGTVPTDKSQAAGSPSLSIDDFNIRLFDWLEGASARTIGASDPERIPGFYLYSHKLFEDPQVVRPVSAPRDLWSIGMLILDAVAELHQPGHQRLRLYPNMSGSGMHWRTRLVDVDTARFSEWGWPEWDGASFAYSTGPVSTWAGCLSTPARPRRRSRIASWQRSRSRYGLA